MLGVSGMDRYQLGNRQFIVGSGHHQEISSFRQEQDEPGGSIQFSFPPSIHNFPDGVCQLRVGQAGFGLSRIEDLHRYSLAAGRSGENRQIESLVEPSMARSASISPTTITSCVTVRSSVLLSGRYLPIRTSPAQTGGLFLIYDAVPVTVARQGDVVDLAGAPSGDEAVLDVAGDQVRLALEGISITSSAWQAQDDPLLSIHTLLALGMESSAVSGAHRPRGPGRATLDALGRATGAVVHGREDPGRVAAHP